MAITGALDADGRDLVLTRTVPAAAKRLWAHLTDSELLATWYGTYRGDPAGGSVEVTMTAEPGEAASATYTVHACEPARLLTVSSAMGEDTWRLSLALEERADGSTVVSLRHHDVPSEMVQHIGPGWEWYLDRLTGAVTGGAVPGTEVWDEQYMALAPEYAALTT